MTREEIQAELDALKGTRFDRLNDNKLLVYEKDCQCSVCKNFFDVTAISRHEKMCKRNMEILPSVLELYDDPRLLTIKEIGRLLNIDEQGMNRIFRENNLKVFPIDRLEEKIKQIYHNGKQPTFIEIAKSANTTKDIVIRVCKKNGLRPWHGGPTMGQRRLDLAQQIEPLYKKGLNSNEIAKILEVESAQVRKLCRAMGWPFNSDHIIQGKIDEEKCLELYRQGLTDQEIIEITGWTSQKIGKYRIKHNLPPNKKSKKK